MESPLGFRVGVPRCRNGAPGMGRLPKSDRGECSPSRLAMGYLSGRVGEGIAGHAAALVARRPLPDPPRKRRKRWRESGCYRCWGADNRPRGSKKRVHVARRPANAERPAGHRSRCRSRPGPSAHSVEGPGSQSQPPPPACGARAATGPTIRWKSAFEPGLPWIGTCWATSSFSRAMLRNNTTALALTFARFPPAAGGL
jgi:hypothetical protein